MESQKKNNNGNTNREKKNKRKEILEKKKAIDELIKAASAPEKDHLASFPLFRHFNRNGLSVYLESGRGDKLSTPVKQYIQNLLKVNMEGPFGSEWPTQEKVKRKEMVAPEARYIFVHEALNAGANEMSTMLDREKPNRMEYRGPMVGFVHYRFTVEEEIPILYVYELQLEPRVQGKGLGKFLMQLIELIARKNCMGAVVLTVQKANLSAMNFYISKLRYMISSISPSRVDPLTGEKSYEILCKAFDHEARAILEMLDVRNESEEFQSQGIFTWGCVRRRRNIEDIIGASEASHQQSQRILTPRCVHRGRNMEDIINASEASHQQSHRILTRRCVHRVRNMEDIIGGSEASHQQSQRIFTRRCVRRGRNMEDIIGASETSHQQSQGIFTRRCVRQRNMEDIGASEASHQPSLTRQRLSSQMQPSQETQSASLNTEPSQGSHDPSSTSASKSTKRGRGCAKQIEGWGTEKLICSWNDHNQPLGKEGAKLNTQLGNFARNEYRFPLTKFSWDHQNPDALESVWNEVKANTNAPNGFKSICFKKMNYAWKRHKSEMKKIYYQYTTDEERLANPPKEVEANEWGILVRYWGLPEAQKEAERNKKNRELLCAYPRTGRVPFAAIREERVSRKESTDPISMWRHTRKMKNKRGGPSYYSQDDGAADVDAQLEAALLDLAEEERDNVEVRESIFREVIGQDGHGRTRMMGVGITPSFLRSESSTADDYEECVRVETERVQKEFEEREHAQTIEVEQRFQSEIQQIRAETDQIRVAAEERERLLQDDIARLRAEFMAFVNSTNLPGPKT